MAKLQPAVMNLNFRIGASDTHGWIDISQAASIVNRRFYRQGLQWAVAGVTLQQNSDTATAGSLKVETLPTTWVCSNAWHKSYAVWKRQQDEALADSESQSSVARFRDFKIFMDIEHVNNYYDGTPAQNLNVTNLIPRTAGGDFSTGEWEPVMITIPNAGADPDDNPAEYHLHMVGPNTNPTSVRSKGIIDGYANSRAVPQSPDPDSPTIAADDNWMNRMFNVGDDNPLVLANATDENDELPYSQLDYPGDENNAPYLQLVSEHYISGQGSINTRINVNGFMAPCGLIKISSGPEAILDVQVHLVPGNHRGYLAEPMQDM
jgi:hypothetical protein